MKCPKLTSLEANCVIPPLIFADTFDELTFLNATLHVPVGKKRIIKVQQCGRNSSQ